MAIWYPERVLWTIACAQRPRRIVRAGKRSACKPERDSDGERDMRVSEAHDLVTLKQKRVFDSDKQDNRRSQLDLE